MSVPTELLIDAGKMLGPHSPLGPFASALSLVWIVAAMLLAAKLSR